MGESGYVSKIVLLVLSLALASCAGITAGPIPVSSNTDGRLASIHKAITDDCLAIPAPGDDSEAARIRRNSLVTAYLFAADMAYNGYERQLLDSVRSGDTGAAIASLALSTVGGVVVDQQVTRALSAANAIITGTHTAIGRDYLLNQTVSILQTQMRASRAAQRAVILGRLRVPYADWTSCLALSDALSYEQAGTLNAALIAVAQAAGQANRVNQERAENAIPTAEYGTGALVGALRTYLDPDGSNIDARVALALRAMAAAGLGPQGNMSPGARLGELVDDQQFEDERRRLITKIIELEQDAEAKAALRGALEAG